MTQPGGGSDTATRDATVNLNANVGPYVQNLRAAEAQTNRNISAVDVLDAKLRNLGAGVSSHLKNLGARDFAFLGVATADAATFQKQLGTLNATAAVTNQRFVGTKGAIESAFVSLPTSRTNLIALAGAISDLGISGSRDLGTLLTVFTKLSAATGESAIGLASGLIQLGRAFGQTNATQIGNMANVVLTVSKNAGTSATSVIDFANSIAPLARQAGIGEAAVLGISSAFSKAGADGFVAGNAFNSIVSDITQLTKSGSPELAKYANLVGMTVAQFKAAGGQTQISDVFTAITKQGPAAINTLQRLGVADGVRAQSAIAAVSAGGGLQAAIDQATGASGNQNNLNKGAGAAMNNLADSLAKLRNQFTQIGTAIGTTFLGPLQIGVNMMTKFLQTVQQVMKPLSPLIALFAGVAGAVAIAASAFGTLSGVIAPAAIALLLLRSGPGKAFREGVSANQAVKGESDEARLARLGRNETLTRMNMHEDGTQSFPLRARIGYRAGAAVGSALPEHDPLGGPGIIRQAGVGAIRGVGAGARWLISGQTRLLADATRSGYARSAYQTGEEPAAGGPGFGARLRGGLATNQAAAAEAGYVRTLRANAATVTGAFKDLAVQTLKTAVNVATLGKVGTARTGLAGGAESGLLSRAGTAGGRLGRAIGSQVAGLGPLGIAAIGIPAGLEAYGAIHSALNKNSDLTTDLNPLQKLNDQFGIATTEVASFANAARTAQDKLAGVAPAATLKAATLLTSEATSAGRTTSVTDKNLSALAKYGKTDTAAQLAYLQSLNITDPATLQKLQPQLVKAFGAKQAGVLLSEYGKSIDNGTQGSPDYSKFGGALVRSEANGFGSVSRSGSGASLAGAQASAIQIQNQVSTTKYGQQYADTQELGNILQSTQGAIVAAQKTAGGASGDKGTRAIQTQADQLKTLLGGGSYDKGLQIAANKGLTGDALNASIVKTIGNTKQGKAFLQGLPTDVQNDPTKIMAALATLRQNTSPANAAIQATGPLGQFATSNSSIAGAIAAPGSPGAQFTAMTALAQEAGKGGAALTDTVAGLDKLMGAIQDTTDPLYQLAAAAKAAAQTVESQTVTPYQSRAQSVASAASQYQEATNANNVNPTKDTAGALATAQANYASAQQAQTQYELQAYESAKQFGTQMERAEQDQNTQIAYATKDFHTSQLYAQQDFEKSKLRSTQDFALQLQRQAQSAAQSIYDPFTRIQAKYTADAGTVVQNLENQNAAIGKQFAQLGQLKDMGITQDTINTLQLADPNNAQQTNNLVSSLTNDPALVAKINAAVAARISSTTQLTQSSFSNTYTNTIQDFNTQMSRASADYTQAEKRAVDAQTLSMDRMATAYNLMVQRSAQDLGTSMTELYGNFAENYGMTIGEINTQIGKYAPDIAKTLDKTLTDMYATIGSVTITVRGAGGVMAGGQSVHDAVNSIPHAMGTISTKQHTATVSEGGRPEAIIPLDQRGQQFLTPFVSGITMAVLKTLMSKGYAAPGMASPSGTQTTMIDQSTQYTGEITVVAQDPNAMAKALAEKKRIKALTRPRASTAGSL